MILDFLNRIIQCCTLLIHRCFGIKDYKNSTIVVITDVITEK
ncbi:hypothetical protein [Clostridium sediminicola]